MSSRRAILGSSLINFMKSNNVKTGNFKPIRVIHCSSVDTQNAGSASILCELTCWSVNKALFHTCNNQLQVLFVRGFTRKLEQFPIPTKNLK